MTHCSEIIEQGTGIQILGTLYGSRGWQPAEVEEKKEERGGWGWGEGEEKVEIEGRGGEVEEKKEEGEEKVERRRDLDEEQNLKEYNGDKGCKQ